MLAPWGWPPGRSCRRREWRELYAALDCAGVAAIHPVLHRRRARIRGRRPPHRRLGAGGPRRHRRLARRHRRRLRRRRRTRSPRRRTPSCPRSRARWPPNRSTARITLSGYEGSELLVARLLIESGADVPYVGTACPKTPWSTPIASGSRPRRQGAVPRLAGRRHAPRWMRFEPDLAIGTTPVVQKAKELAIPALYFTNLISARPADGPGRGRQPGAGGQRRHRQQGAHGPDEGLSSRASAPATPPASGKAPEPAPEFRALPKKLAGARRGRQGAGDECEARIASARRAQSSPPAGARAPSCQKKMLSRS
jgi:hypothetical protein